MVEITENLNSLCYKVVGICMEVHRELGPGFPEEYYQNALEYEFKSSNLSFEAQKAIQVFYKEIQVGLNYLDFVIDETLILELKSVREIDNIHRFQVIKYFAASDYPVAIIANFGKDSFQFERLLPPKKIQERKDYNIK